MKKPAPDLSRKDTLSMLSHDLKAPMTVIHSYADLLLEMMPEMGDEGKDILGRIKGAAVKYSRLLDDFVTLSAVESGRLSLDLKPGSLSEVAASSADDLMVLANAKNVTIHTELPCDLPDVHIDEMHTGRVIGNVLANAIKYSQDGGRVWVRAGMDEKDKGKVFVEVMDEGPGIPEEDIPRVTEAYYRAEGHGKREGAGLGLAIVKVLTELHGGSVEIKNKADRGASVRITLPAAGPETPSA